MCKCLSLPQCKLPCLISFSYRYRWWSSVEGYKPAKEKTSQEKEATRLEARRLLQLQAPEGLKVALGPTATTVALGRLHDCLQGQGAEAIVSSMMLDYLRLLLL